MSRTIPSRRSSASAEVLRDQRLKRNYVQVEADTEAMLGLVEYPLALLGHIGSKALYVPDVFATKGHADVRSRRALPLLEADSSRTPAILLEGGLETAKDLFCPLAARLLNAPMVVRPVVLDERIFGVVLHGDAKERITECSVSPAMNL